MSGAAFGATHTVNQVGLTFQPSDITISQGDTVEWIWSSGGHTVTEGTPCTYNGGFNEPLNSSNPTVTLTFTDVGTIEYFCQPHCGLGMVGSITIEAASPAVPTFGQWGLIALGVTLVGAAAVVFARRRPATA
jgi:plastocyanin